MSVMDDPLATMECQLAPDSMRRCLSALLQSRVGA
jgi:hypothetical protein